ncbi:DMT family transporter [uncultured Meiothermus sp.]|uniref:DMT family transporter n=1 Tax=uncultured Meiothermus sp. TaxID=157471 RepID=UPI0026165DD6|nr:DMT family transporter [uncultured Meiothermus sp.]
MSPYLFPLYSVLAWGLNFALMKVLVAQLPPHAMNSLRTLLAGAIFLLLWRFRERLTWRDWLMVGGIGILGNVAYQSLFLEAVPRLSASYNTIISATGPVWVALISAWWLRERLSLLGYVGFALSFLGVVGLSWGGEGRVELLGVFFSLGAAVVWAFYTVASRWFGERYRLLTWTGAGFIVGMLPYWLWHLPETARLDSDTLSPLVLLGITASAVFALVLAFLTWIRAVQLLGPVRVAPFQYLTPLVGVTAGVLLLGETLTWVDLMAGAVILLGVLVTQRAKLQ